MTYNTQKRTELLAFLEKSGGAALTAEEICAGVLKDGKGKSTVYRLIARLVDEGAMRKICDVKTRHVTYQYIKFGHCEEHLHLKCKECGVLLHLDRETSKFLERKIKSQKGFVLDDGALLYGTCEVCKR